jgi:hypothetical protein
MFSRGARSQNACIPRPPCSTISNATGIADVSSNYPAIPLANGAFDSLAVGTLQYGLATFEAGIPVRMDCM